MISPFHFLYCFLYTDGLMPFIFKNCLLKLAVVPNPLPASGEQKLDHTDFLTEDREITLHVK